LGIQTILALLLLIIIQIPLLAIYTLGSSKTVSLTSPLFTVLTSLLTAAAVVFSIWIAGKILDKRQFSEFGLQLDQDWGADFCFGIGLGAVLMLLIFLVELSLGWVEVDGFFSITGSELPFYIAILVPFLLFVLVGFYEELLSRGYHLTNLAEGLASSLKSPSLAIFLAAVLSSIIFSILHLMNPNSSSMSAINIFGAGLFLGSGYLLTGRLGLPIGLHISWNFFQGNVFGFPVSGFADFTASLISIRQSGPDLWTGGEFGPEGGLIGSLIILLGFALVLLYHKIRYGQVSLHQALAQPPGPTSEKELSKGNLHHG
jgi:membrane protease YdiL (CAAX protease family)